MSIRIRPASALAALTSALALTITAVSAHVPQAPQAKKAPETYKNIQILKDLDADQVTPAMNLIAASLGVDCAFCHVANAPERDDKPQKASARKMMQMTRDLNANAFGGNREITCYSCHHGTNRPVSIPIISDADTPTMSVNPTPAVLPVRDQVLRRYLDAVGGAAALQKITTRVEKGTILAGGTRTPIDVYAKAPNRRITVTHGASGDSMTAFDGKAGWLGSTGRPARDMNPSEARNAGLDAVFAMALDAMTVFDRVLRASPPEKIGDKEMTVLLATGTNTPTAKLYFDPQTGLLMRLQRLDDTGMGFLPVQIDYADYREVDGIKIPFRWTLARTNGRFTIQIDTVQQNVPIDDAKFAKPATGSSRSSTVLHGE